VEGLTAFILTNLRYTNQSLTLGEFDILKTGNIITILLFGIIFLLIFLNIFNSSKLSLLSLVIILICSVGGLLTLIFFNLLQFKDEKVFYVIIFSVINLFILTGLLQLYLSKSGRLQIIRNLFLTVFIFLLSASALFLSVYFYQDDYNLISEKKIDSDAGIIFGAAVWGGNRPSPVLRERINKGYEMWQKQFVKKLVLTGGGSPNEMTEADVAKNELIKYGMKENSLIIENSSNSTIEQIFFLRDKLYRRQKWNSVVLISDNFHLLRVKEIADFNGIKNYTVSTDTPLSAEGKLVYCIKEVFAILSFWMFGIG